MPDFAWVQAPVFTPTSCCTCMTHSDPDGFVDLLADTAIGARLYMCATCVEQAGRRVGMLSEEQAQDLTLRLAAAAAENSQLRGQLEDEKANKVISFADAQKLLKQRSPTAGELDGKKTLGGNATFPKPAPEAA